MHASASVAQTNIYTLPRNVLLADNQHDQSTEDIPEQNVTILLALENQHVNKVRQLLEDNCDVVEASTWEEAVEKSRELEPAVCIVDTKLIEDASGINVSDTFTHHAGQLHTRVVVLSMAESTNMPTNKEMATNTIAIQNHWELRNLLQQVQSIHPKSYNQSLFFEPLQPRINLNRLIGECPKMQEVIETARRVACTDVPVLIHGEDGTEKELLARCIDKEGRNSRSSLTLLNCRILSPDQTISPEMQQQQLDSAIQQATGGTLFLDELDKMPVTMQLNLLNRLFANGEEHNRQVRIISAALPSINRQMECGEFLPELYYRLSVITLDLPPLHQRGNDILLLAYSYLRQFGKMYARSDLTISDDAEEKMMSYHWPGNVREMESRIRRAVIMNRNGAISCEDLGFPATLVAKKKTLPDVLNDIQRKYLDDALSRTRGNVTKSAKELGISRMALYDMLNRFNVDLDAYRRTN